jgi:PAS domain S-box-containing protein
LYRSRWLVPFKRRFSANVWSRHIDSFAWPESDFKAHSNIQVQLQENDSEWSRGLNFSAEWKTERLSTHPTNGDLPLSINYPETAFGSIHLSEIVDEQLLQDLQQEQQQQEEPLPVSLEEIYANPQDPRAIVVTTAQEPFFIVDVNDAWVGLCGYSREESRNHSLAKLLQGPETNQDKIHEFMRLLREGQEVSTVITNYTKEGRKFQNRVRAAPLRERGEITHFVGVLQEIA